MRTQFNSSEPLDPAFHLIPEEQLDRVFNQDMCDIDGSFLGFTNVYMSLAALIPMHWTVIDLGCAYAPQAFIFQNHKAYIGVDGSACERFFASNTTHYECSAGEFIRNHANDFDKEQTFAICSYVPNWFGENAIELTRQNFKNVFTFYPAGERQIAFGRAALRERE
ncbi:hypothetical protein FHS76_000007 [Ochrobactrum daejeonense]|uniref:Methyltransferase n=1 Tax=Brucella daejeonensis TaxID=659015 RepID=A0A7W9EJF6_9HYPH|nr:hypothetical protein [Brucella daejeonensis]MBB5700169.1 hypothetical protein [Brucella daejeonensis]